MDDQKAFDEYLKRELQKPRALYTPLAILAIYFAFMLLLVLIFR